MWTIILTIVAVYLIIGLLYSLWAAEPYETNLAELFHDGEALLIWPMMLLTEAYDWLGWTWLEDADDADKGNDYE